MRTRNLALAALSALLLSSACASKPKKKEAPRVKMGENVKPGRAVLFEPRCEGARGPCDAEFKSAVTGRLASELEFAGYHVIRGDELLASARERTTAGANLEGAGPLGAYWASAGAAVESAKTYADLPPAGKRALLDEAKAEGVIVLSVLVNDDEDESPLYDVHLIELTARYTMGEDEALGWVAQCKQKGESTEMLGGVGVSYMQAADKLAKCVADAIQ